MSYMRWHWVSKKIKTTLGKVRIKIGSYKGKITSIKPEYEDVNRIAIKRKIPLKQAYQQIMKEIS